MSKYTFFPGHAWDPEFKNLIGAETYYVSQTWVRFVSLMAPPADSPGEYEAFRAAAAKRVERHDEIVEQGSLLSLQLWPIVEALQLDNVTKQDWAPTPPNKTALPAVWELLRAALWDMQCGLYALKQRFNRGRPVHIYGSLVGVTSVPTPGHPAYPGGHASQCHAAVLLLEAAIKKMDASSQSDLPQVLSRMLAASERVTENRVVAGIHFPSDSEAGRQLALQYVPLLLQSQLFDAVLKGAADELKKHWPKP